MIKNLSIEKYGFLSKSTQIAVYKATDEYHAEQQITLD